MRRVLMAVAGVITCAFMFPGAGYVLAQSAPGGNLPSAACGVDHTDIKTKQDVPRAGASAPPAGRALVYVIEQMPELGFYTTHVNVGVDGRWVAQLSSRTFTSLVVDPGVHHLCAAYQGRLASSDGATILRRLNVEAGKTYYLLYRGLFSKESGELGFFDEVDEDEGQYALQMSQHVTSTVVAKR